MRQAEKSRNILVVAGLLLMGVIPLVFWIDRPMEVSATSTLDRMNQTKQEIDAAKDQINQTEGEIDSLEGEKNNLEGQFNNLNEQLTQVSDNLETLENQITEKELEIEETGLALEEAKATEEKQYEAMKQRIQFMYERGDMAYLELLFSATSFSDFLNKTEYINQLSEYDGKMLIRYQETRDLIASTEEQLKLEKEELENMKQQALEEQAKVSDIMEAVSSNISAYESDISKAEQEAAAYEAKLAEKEASYATLKAQYEAELALSALALNSAWRDISQVTFAEGDVDLMAAIIYCEAGGEPYAGKLAVGSVVINRVLSSRYPNTVVGVVYQNKQFSPVLSGRLALAIAEGKATASCYQAAQEAMSGVSNVGSCLYFRTPIEGLTGLQIGGHIFY